MFGILKLSKVFLQGCHSKCLLFVVLSVTWPLTCSPGAELQTRWEADEWGHPCFYQPFAQSVMGWNWSISLSVLTTLQMFHDALSLGVGYLTWLCCVTLAFSESVSLSLENVDSQSFYSFFLMSYTLTFCEISTSYCSPGLHISPVPSFLLSLFLSCSAMVTFSKIFSWLCFLTMILI